MDANSPTDEVNEAVSSLQGAIDTERVGGTNMINIIATSSEPKKAMDMANTVAEVYINDNLLEKGQGGQERQDFY